MEVLTMTPQEKLEHGLLALERDHRATKRDIQCITKTWDEFTEEYLPYLKMLAQRERDRAELRKAIIKHTTLIAVGVVVLFVLNAVWNEVIMAAKDSISVRPLK